MAEALPKRQKYRHPRAHGTNSLRPRPSMKLIHACGYYSGLAVKAGKPRPRNPPFWEAYMFCWAVKSGEFHGNFYIERKEGRLNITRNNFQLVRPTFGSWAAKNLPTF